MLLFCMTYLFNEFKGKCAISSYLSLLIDNIIVNIEVFKPIYNGKLTEKSLKIKLKKLVNYITFICWTLLLKATYSKCT